MRRFPDPLIAVLLVVAAGCTPSPLPMAGEEPGDAAAPPHVESVTVWAPEPGGLTAPADTPFLAEMAPALAAEIMAVFSEAETYTLVEREKLLLVLEELNLGSSELVSPDTRLEIGRLVGAKWMVFSVYQVFRGTFRLDLRRVAVETGQVAGAASETAPAGDPGRWPAAARAAATRLLESVPPPLPE